MRIELYCKYPTAINIALCYIIPCEQKNSHLKQNTCIDCVRKFCFYMFYQCLELAMIMKFVLLSFVAVISRLMWRISLCRSSM